MTILLDTLALYYRYVKDLLAIHIPFVFLYLNDQQRYNCVPSTSMSLFVLIRKNKNGCHGQFLVLAD